MRLKLLVGSLLASLVALAMFAGSASAFSVDAHAVGLAQSNPAKMGSTTTPIFSGYQPSPVLEITNTTLITNTNPVTTTTGMTTSNKIINAIVDYLGNILSSTVTVSDATGLRNEDWGFGEIFKLYQLSLDSGQSADQIKAMRDSGMGWGEIAKALDQSPGNKGTNLGAAVSGRNASGAQTTNPTSNSAPHGNSQNDPPEKSGNGGPSPDKGNNKNK
jgi:hypothetical protein